MRANRSYTDYLGLRHSLQGLVAGGVGLMLAAAMLWLPGAAALLAAAGASLLVLSGVDTAVMTVRRKPVQTVHVSHSPDQAERPDQVALLSMDWAKWSAMATIMLCFVGVCTTLATQGGEGSVLMWLITGVFGFGAVIAMVVGVLGPRTFVRLDRDGVLESTHRPRRPLFVAWDDLESAEVMSGGSRSVGVLLHVRGRSEPVFVATTFLKGGAQTAFAAITGHEGFQTRQSH